jgi:hypothetical protein
MLEDTRREIEGLLAPWAANLGADWERYRNHVMRVLALCDRMADPDGSATPPPSARREFVIAAAFHDLGIWTAGTLDYLAPSAQLARAWLARAQQAELVPLVVEMIEQHHKLTAAGPLNAPVEVFRRADTMDFTLGARSFGLPRREYRALLRAYPDAGFHRRLVELAARRALRHPRSPLPMLKW